MDTESSGSDHHHKPPAAPRNASSTRKKKRDSIMCASNALNEKLEDTFTELRQIWDRVGFQENARRERLDTAIQHFIALADDMLKEEIIMETSTLQTIDKYMEEVASLCKELKQAMIQIPPTSTSLDRVEALTVRLIDLRSMRNARLLRYQRALHDFKRAAQRLGLPCPHDDVIVELDAAVDQFRADSAYMSAHGQQNDSEVSGGEQSCVEERDENVPAKIMFSPVPAEAEINCMESEVVCMQQELKKREKVYLTIQGRAGLLMTKLEIAPRNDLERAIMQSADTENVVLSDSVMNSLNLLEKELEDAHAAFVAEIERLIGDTREELEKWWDLCCVSDEEKEKMPVLSEENYNVDRLEEQKAEVQRLQRLYECKKEILADVNAWKDSFRRLQELEQKANDSSRFNNRGGAMQKELNEQNRLRKHLPSMETTLIQKVQDWEHKNKSHFRIYGQSVPEFVKQEHEAVDRMKAEERREREEKKRQERDYEMRFGTVAPSPRKKGATPNRTMARDKTLRFAGSTADLHRTGLPNYTVMRSPMKRAPGGTSASKPPVHPVKKLQPQNTPTLSTALTASSSRVPATPTSAAKLATRRATPQKLPQTPNSKSRLYTAPSSSKDVTQAACSSRLLQRMPPCTNPASAAKKRHADDSPCNSTLQSIPSNFNAFEKTILRRGHPSQSSFIDDSTPTKRMKLRDAK